MVALRGKAICCFPREHFLDVEMLGLAANPRNPTLSPDPRRTVQLATWWTYLGRQKPSRGGFSPFLLRDTDQLKHKISQVIKRCASLTNSQLRGGTDSSRVTLISYAYTAQLTSVAHDFHLQRKSANVSRNIKSLYTCSERRCRSASNPDAVDGGL